MLPFIRHLNDNQYNAVTGPVGDVIINAAAGTGKTSTLAARILYLQIEKNIEPEEMLALSFSRSARQGLISKMEAYRKEAGAGSPIETLTFHGLAFRIVRVAASLGETWLKPGFKIIENNKKIFEDNAAAFFKGIEYKKNQDSLYSKVIDSVRQGHEHYGQALYSPDQIVEDEQLKVESEQGVRVSLASLDVKRVWKRYATYLKRKNQIDYPGLISEAINVIKNSGQLTLNRIRTGIRHLFIDEFQDTSMAQEELAFLLAGNQMYMTVVGDNEQTIYAFNGSNESNIIHFHQNVARRKGSIAYSIDLIENYRSSANILGVANRIVEKGNSAYKKWLRTAENVSEEVALYQYHNHPVTLVRMPRLHNAATYIAEEILRLHEEEEILYSDITVLVRKDTEFSPQGSEVKRLLEEKNIPVGVTRSGGDNQKIVFDKAEEICQSYYDEPLASIIDSIEKGDIDPDLDSAIERGIIDVFKEAVDSGAVFAYDALDFLIDSTSGEGSEREDDGVRIRTVHSAKGLEFKVVFVLFLGDKSFPHGAVPDVDGERRLLYVAITRAQDRLYMIGRNGIHGPDFFGECMGSETRLVDYFKAPDAAISSEGCNEQLKSEVDLLKEKFDREEAARRDRLMALFEDDDF
ncbi:ATP-dependent helicase [Domibacillus enclensis]|uniref:DNA 3'-5' helicase n=1 Tax=Domibacillus enclensis TaxID=1017273 RepID=A0A1N7C4D7_9BACI|nr:ATP-dependent helicase [Domibacillus enclensis]SIR58448.1 DNA helicase-2 / ATP-dependent DNA helicase PcrA [Domibacillus enclensis]